MVLVSGFVVLLFNSGARFAMSLMLYPMVLGLGWTRTTLSSTVTLFMVVSALALPVVGQLVDRVGARSVLAVGVTLSALALGCMGFIEAPWHALVLYGTVFALGSAATSITPIGVMLSRWYPERAGMANSIAISGMGVGQLLIISVLAAQLMTLGWRGAYIGLGIAMALCVLPLIAFAGRGQPSTAQSTVADHDPAVAIARAGGRGRGQGGALVKLLRDRQVWALAVMYGICGFQDFLVATHIVAFALDEGISALTAGNMLAFMGLAGLLGVLVTGALNDRYGPRVPTAICFVVRIGLFAAVLVSRDATVIVAIALAYGLTFWITAPLTIIFARALTGAALLGTLSGLITMVHHISGGMGALVGARIFDVNGSYDQAMWLLLGLSVVALASTPGLPRSCRPAV